MDAQAVADLLKRREISCDAYLQDTQGWQAYATSCRRSRGSKRALADVQGPIQMSKVAVSSNAPLAGTERSSQIGANGARGYLQRNRHASSLSVSSRVLHPTSQATDA
eukprot:CAMPEP_0183377806 /NCGR_PEP_ID=MMETSP0164_2-20130417/124016_1 /TAXON_ID=221442 /ORGANISM="Coccolithus pelagicus ssp braarudi, Strain PLY182g" /LENGTH=107 /DNA_ID=CAMNT_0025555309 /DNA_START=56 /DNA_END=375 /DNA_ORIENTATION=-